MSKPLTIAFLAYDRFQLLDVTGPAAVFAAANHERKRNLYDVVILSPAGGAVRSDSGVAVQSRAIAGIVREKRAPIDRQRGEIIQDATADRAAADALAIAERQSR